MREKLKKESTDSKDGLYLKYLKDIIAKELCTNMS